MPFHDPHHDDNDNQDVEFLAQQQAILGSLSHRRQRIQRQIVTVDEQQDDNDDKAADALLDIALYESVCSHQQDQATLESERLARHLHLQEMKEADQELASALQVSEQEARQHEAYEALTADKVSQSQERHAGSWDCPSCTFTNPPLEPSCQACACRAPDHILVFGSIPDLCFGLEIEILVPNGKRDGLTLPSIAKNLTMLGEPAVQFLGYSHQTTLYWKMVTDASIQGMEDDLCFELVSPVLRGMDGIHQLRRMMDHVRRLGIATNSSCGFHVHVDATPTSTTSSSSSSNETTNTTTTVQVHLNQYAPIVIATMT